MRSPCAGLGRCRLSFLGVAEPRWFLESVRPEAVSRDGARGGGGSAEPAAAAPAVAAPCRLPQPPGCSVTLAENAPRHLGLVSRGDGGSAFGEDVSGAVCLPASQTDFLPLKARDGDRTGHGHGAHLSEREAPR